MSTQQPSAGAYLHPPLESDFLQEKADVHIPVDVAFGIIARTHPAEAAINEERLRECLRAAMLVILTRDGDCSSAHDILVQQLKRRKLVAMARLGLRYT